MPLYLVHFEKPYQHARHYLGFVEKIEGLPSRLDYRRKGRGSKLLKAVSDAGIAWAVVRTWDRGTRSDERRLKAHSSTRLCPVCSPKSAGRGRLTSLKCDQAAVISP